MLLWDNTNGANTEALPVLDVLEAKNQPLACSDHGYHLALQELLVFMCQLVCAPSKGCQLH